MPKSLPPKLYLQTLYQPEESICLGKDKYGVNPTPIAEVIGQTSFAEYQYVTLNAIKDRRMDDNVTSLRNFLLEFDGIPLEDQLKVVKESGIPYSAITYSGSKSYHFIVSLARSKSLLNTKW